MADVGERPARLDPHVDVDSAATGGLWEAGIAELAEQLARLAGDAYGVVEVGPRLRVEVDPQLVGMVDVGASHRPRVEGQRAHLRAPADDRDLGRADLVGVAPRGELDPGCLEVVRRSPGNALLVEGVALLTGAGGQLDPRMDALRPALERRRPLAQRAHDSVLDCQVILDHLELGDLGRPLGRREDHPVRTRHPQLAATGVEHHGL
jgi:hypothetical protein